MDQDKMFRFWDHTNGEWTIIERGVISIEKFPIFQFMTGLDGNPIEVTQSIGFRDVNKNMIFVGDWVEIQDNGKDLYLICHDGMKYYARRYMIDYRCYCENCINDEVESDCWTYEDLDIYYALRNPKIVGTIFEDPELYKVG